jgi:hypothetical protein
MWGLGWSIMRKTAKARPLFQPLTEPSATMPWIAYLQFLEPEIDLLKATVAARRKTARSQTTGNLHQEQCR